MFAIVGTLIFLAFVLVLLYVDYRRRHKEEKHAH